MKKIVDDPALWDALNAATGDEEILKARTAIVIHYQPLVQALSRKISLKIPPQVEFDSLVSYGQEGLLKALNRFEPEIGVFSKWASTLIYGAILDGLRREDWAPRNLRRDVKAINLKMDELVQEHHLVNDPLTERPTYEDVADALGIEYSHVRAVMQKMDALQPTAFHDYDRHMDEDPESLESRGSVAYMLNIFSVWFDSLTFREQSILTIRYFEDRSLHLVAKELQVPESKIRETHTRLILDLQRTMLQSVQLQADVPVDDLVELDQGLY